MLGKIKKYIWAIALGAVALVSFTLAVLTNRFIASKIAAPETVQGLPPPGAGAARQSSVSSPVAQNEPPASATGSSPPTPQPPAAEETGGAPGGPEAEASQDPAQWHETYRVILTRNIFDSATSLDWPEVVKTEEPGGGVSRGPLSIRLLGTVSASPAQFSWALIARNDANAQPDTFRIGDDLYGEGTLKEVRRNQIVVLRGDGTEETVDLFTGEVAAAAPPPPPGPAAAPGGLGESIRKVGENKYEIDSKDIKAAMDNMEQLASAARIVPSFENGNPVGFKVFRIKPDSFYNKLGIRNGDVISKINGFEINSTEKALQMYQILRTEKNISLDITRRGQKMTMEYTIR
jgi:general secretion pathway protein C